MPLPRTDDSPPSDTSELEALTRIVDKATQDYSRQLDLTTEMLRDASKSFDQTLITLAAGAIALSVTYLRPEGAVSRSLLIGWVSFGLSLSLALLSFKLVQLPLAKRAENLSRAIRRAERGLSQALVGDTAKALESFAPEAGELMLEKDERHWRRVVDACSLVAVISFLVGVTMLLMHVARRM